MTDAHPHVQSADKQSPEPVDAVIVGAGPAGGVYAHRLAQANLKVVVLEAGNDWNLGDMRSSSLWARRLKYSGTPVRLGGEHPLSHNVSMGSGTGGAAIHHYGTWPRLSPDVFLMQTLHGRGFDWPIDYEQLRSWYDRVQAEVDIAGDAAQEPWRGPGDAYPLKPLRSFRAGEILARGFRELGLPVSPLPATIMTEPFKGRPACLYDGWCDAGCPIGALSNPLFTYLAWARERGVELRNRSVVTRVLSDAKGRAEGVAYRTADGKERVQMARIVVLAGSVIQNPRLMLNSVSAAHPNGIANGNGLVGRYLSADAMGFTYGLFAEPLDNWMGVSAGQFYSRGGLRYPERDELIGGHQWQIAPALKPNDLFGVAATRPDLYGHALHGFVHEASRHLSYMVSFAGAEASRECRVEIESGTQDKFGVPLARAIHRHDANTLALWDLINHQGLAVMRAAGARQTWNGAMAGGHMSGGTIMGADPTASVCDGFGRTHEVPNLIVAGAGTFPQTCATSPTFTLHAVALRSAEHIATHFSDYSRPI